MPDQWWYVCRRGSYARLYFLYDPAWKYPIAMARNVLGVEKFQPGNRLRQVDNPPKLQSLGVIRGIEVFTEAPDKSA